METDRRSGGGSGGSSGESSNSILWTPGIMSQLEAFYAQGQQLYSAAVRLSATEELDLRTGKLSHIGTF